MRQLIYRIPGGVSTYVAAPPEAIQLVCLRSPREPYRPHLRRRLRAFGLQDILQHALCIEADASRRGRVFGDRMKYSAKKNSSFVC